MYGTSSLKRNGTRVLIRERAKRGEGEVYPTQFVQHTVVSPRVLHARLAHNCINPGEVWTEVVLSLSFSMSELLVLPPENEPPVTLAPCGHEQLLNQLLNRILELSDTLVALNGKFECVNNVNFKLEERMKLQEKRCREYALSSAKLLADLELLGEELDRARARERQLLEGGMGVREAATIQMDQEKTTDNAVIIDE